MSESEKAIYDQLTKADQFFRRYTSRLFFVWLVCMVLHIAGIFLIIFIDVEKSEILITYMIDGKLIAYISGGFIVMNFVQKCVDSTKLEALAKIIEAARG